MIYPAVIWSSTQNKKKAPPYMARLRIWSIELYSVDFQRADMPILTFVTDVDAHVQ